MLKIKNMNKYGAILRLRQCRWMSYKQFVEKMNDFAYDVPLSRDRLPPRYDILEFQEFEESNMFSSLNFL